MRIAIQFDDQFQVYAGKIRNERPDRMLPAEFPALKLAAPQPRPEQTLRKRSIPAQGARTSDRCPSH